MYTVGTKPFKKILVPLDGSPTAEAIIPYASKLARDFNSFITLLHVASHREEGPVDTGFGFDDEVAIDPEVLIAERLREVSVRLRSEGLSVKSILAYGPAAERIVGFSEKNHYDLIAISTRGRSVISRWVCGSVASRVIGSSRTPLLVVKPESSRGTPKKNNCFRKILVPLDGSNQAETVLPAVRALSANTGCEITLVRVVKPISLPERAQKLVEVSPKQYVAALRSIDQHHRDVAHDYLNAVKWELMIAGSTPEVLVAEGDPAAQIITLSRNMQRPLIAIATHGRTGISRSMLGSVADRVLRGCSSPVLLFCPGTRMLGPDKARTNNRTRSGKLLRQGTASKPAELPGNRVPEEKQVSMRASVIRDCSDAVQKG